MAAKRRYVAIGLYWADAPDKVSILAVEGHVVLFDTAAVAREVLPRLGGAGRIPSWGRDGESIAWTPLSFCGFNRACIITGYDPYNVPNGSHERGTRSEAEGRDWRWHTLFWYHHDPLIAMGDAANADAWPEGTAEGQDAIEAAAAAAGV